MKANLPEKNFFDSFYIWFNKEKREEYYSTPLYLYSVNRKDDFENRLLTLYFDKSEVKGRTKEEQGLKYPGNMYFPYVERFGMFLLRFLNANLETYESAYETGTEDAETDGGNNKSVRRIHIWSNSRRWSRKSCCIWKKEVVSVHLEEEVVDPDDIEMLEDLIVAATNEALRKMEEDSQEKMGKVTGGLGGMGGGFPF